MPYKLSRTLLGHASDVRCLCVGPDGTIFSGSRDNSAVVWKPKEDNNYKIQNIFSGHKHYVSAVCILPPSSVYPKGLFVTGSHDYTIQIYQPDDKTPTRVIKAHHGTVSHLSPADEGRFLSSSWDTTVKLWSILSDTHDLVLHELHTMAMWCSIFVENKENKYIITGCADHYIRVYKIDGDFYRNLVGHKDCIRGLCYVGDGVLLSCANDASIKRWDVDKGVCLETMYGHPNYIYSLACSSDGGLIVSGGEDRCLRIWSQNNAEYLTIPAQSVWSVGVLPNMDVVVGSSDGLIRVFTLDESRMASENELSKYEAEVTLSNAENEKGIEGINIEEVPSKDALNEPGATNGQVKMVREDDHIVCYKWSQSLFNWQKIGKVLGASGGTPQTSGKVLHEGKEYDYVFNIDLEDNKPPIKLPYNAAEDPWAVAQNFIEKYRISSSFLSQIANFIISNSTPVAVTNTNVMENSFSGCENTTQLFPQLTYVRFDQANAGLISKKILEFNQKLLERGLQEYNTKDLEEVMKLTELNSTPRSEAIEVLRQLLLWPSDLIFPVLDIYRLAVRRPDVNSSLCSGDAGTYLMSTLHEMLVQRFHRANGMLALKLLSNLFSCSPGEKLCVDNTVLLLQRLVTVAEEGLPRSFQIAMATLLLNISVAHVNRCNHEILEHCRLTTFLIINKLDDDEAILRGLVALGTLLYQIEKPVVPEHILKFLKYIAETKQLDKIKMCCNQILDLVQRKE